MQLAEFLVSAESLMLRYELSGYTPAANGATVDSATVTTLNAQMAAATIPQPTIAQMSNFWDPVKNFGLNILNGSITHDNAAEMIAKTMELLNSTGL